MALVKISQKEGRVPVTVFHLQDRVNLGNYVELSRQQKMPMRMGCETWLLT